MPGAPALLDLAETVFVSIDIQPRAHRVWTAENRHPDFVRDGFDADDLNAAERHFQATALPNALRLAAWARRNGLPRVFVHWAGDGPDNRPHDRFELFPEDHVVPKTMRDAFPSSDFGRILERLGRKTLLLVGGHTQGCLGQTARSALERGYRCVLARDASFDCSLLRWPKGIAAVDYDLILETEEVLRLGR
jgi:nicotinamidase-related amidase